MRSLLLLLVLCASLAAPRTATARPRIVAQFGDAYIGHDSGADTWLIGSADLELTLGFDASRTLAIQSLFNATTSRSWIVAPGADTTVTLGGETAALTASGNPVSLVSAQTEATDAGVLLTFTFEHRARSARIQRFYATYPGSPTIETWTRIESLGAPLEVSNLIAWRLTVPDALVRWLGGLRGDSADNPEAGAFELAERNLDPGERIEIGGDRRSTEQFIPFVIVDNGRDEFYGGLMWSGSWRIGVERSGGSLNVSAYVPNVATAAGAGAAALELPHAFFGVTTDSVTDESGALRRFLLNGIRRGRPLEPLVTYNTWFAYGVTINEDAMVAEMDMAASLGVELFVVDAGWYVGAGENGDFDFDSGLGSWEADPERFPSSLTSLADYAHGVGMKFGLWVEPMRVALSVTGQPGMVQRAWLATEGGEYGQPSNAQICIVQPDAFNWVLNRIVSLVDQIRPDYLKWDDNLWVNCDRPGHGHGSSDGGFQHVRALYSMLAALRTRYPELLIENVSGGGNRIDFGLLAYTDTAWMDDRTSPSSHVRHNLEGLTFAYPPAYLLSFLIAADGDPIMGSDDLPLAIRSRMPGTLGLTYRATELDSDTADRLREEIGQYKTIRPTLARANATLLSAQAPVDEDGWDVLQEIADGGASGVIFAFKGSASEGRLVVKPRSLLADAVYDVTSFDAGALGSARGDVLMADGIELNHSPAMSRAHVVVLRAR